MATTGQRAGTMAQDRDGPAGGHGLRLLHARPDRVRGQTTVDDAGPVTLAALFGFAETLVAAGNAAAGHAATAFDVKTVALSPRAAGRLTGEARRHPAPPGLAVWEVAVQDDEGHAIATLLLTFVIGAAAPEPPVPAAPEPAKEDTPFDRILAAATEVIARKGFAQATMREIAEATGMHAPTLYAHVKGKDELLEHVYTQEMERMARDLERVATGASASERIRRMMEAALQVSDERRRQVGILNRELKSLRPEARIRMIARYRALVGRYEAVIREGIDAGEFRQIDTLVAANFLDMISDIWALRPFFFAGVPLEEYRDAAIAFALSGLQGPQAAPPAPTGRAPG